MAIASRVSDKERWTKRDREPVGPVAGQQLFFKQIRIVLQIAVEVVFVVVIEDELTGNQAQLERGGMLNRRRRRSLTFLAVPSGFTSGVPAKELIKVNPFH